MKVFLAVAVVVLIGGSYATLLIKGPTEPVLEGQKITLECMYSDSEFNISKVHFEMFSKYMKRWHPVFHRYWCRGYGIQLTKTAESLVLSIPRASLLYEGPYRCVSHEKNVTAPDNSSEELAFKVHYMGQLSLTREGYTRYMGISEELKVRPGDDVVLQCSASSSEEPYYTWYKDGSDWVLPSSKLTLKKVSAEDKGQYTCVAEHPSVESFRKSRTITITLLSEDAPWYETSNGRLILMTCAVLVAVMLFIIMSTFLCCRAKRSRTSKGPIDDHSQKKPIYKSSVDSLPSTCADKQPLV